MNRRDVRQIEFAQHREWAERFGSERLREMIVGGVLHGGKATAVKEVLRNRGETVG